MMQRSATRQSPAALMSPQKVLQTQKTACAGSARALQGAVSLEQKFVLVPRSDKLVDARACMQETSDTIYV